MAEYGGWLHCDLYLLPRSPQEGLLIHSFLGSAYLSDSIIHDIKGFSTLLSSVSLYFQTVAMVDASMRLHSLNVLLDCRRCLSMDL